MDIIEQQQYDIVDELEKEERIRKRNSPESAKRFFEEWIPMENTYHERMNVKERCELKIFVG